MDIVVDYALWNKCGIETPDICRDPTTFTTNNSGGEKRQSQMTINITLALIAAYSLIRNGVAVVV